MDVYRTVGVQIPRNSEIQAKALKRLFSWSDGVGYARRMADLNSAAPGDLLMMPGHVMMYLGTVDEVAYAIHAFVGYGEMIGGAVREVLVDAVEVSSLAMAARRGVAYLNAVSVVCRVF